MTSPPLTARGRIALMVGAGARWASRITGRGSGAMIGGLVAMTLDRSVLGQLATGRKTVLITGTNGKSTTTRMVAAALATIDSPAPGRGSAQATTNTKVATNGEGANMDAGIVAALAGSRTATCAALEVDEMHMPHIADAVNPAVIVLLNLSRDQLDRVGEINTIERALRAGLARHRDAVIVANCDDVLVTSAAYDCPNVMWVAAGGGWAHDSVSCPRSGEKIIREGDHWYSSGADFQRPQPQWWCDSENLYSPKGLVLSMRLSLPGSANRGNAAQAVAAATALGAELPAAVAAVAAVDEVSGRYSITTLGAHTVRVLLAKNPAGWQEALAMVDVTAAGIVIAVNGQVPDGEDLSWLWDVDFEYFSAGRQGYASAGVSTIPLVASGERGTDLAVRLGYADVPYTLVHNVIDAIASCPPGRIEVVANYTAFLQLTRALGRRS